MLAIKDSVAVITGGGGGIGKALGKYWVENGGKVLLTDVVQAPNNKTIAKISVELGSRGTMEIMTLPVVTV